MKHKKHHGIEELKAKYGLMFITPWIVGILFFFLIPIVQSIIYSLSDVTIGVAEMKTSFVGFEHYKYILMEDPKYTVQLSQSLASLAYQLPLIVIVSLVLALLLNRKFKGRIFFRALYFLPVIIASGIILKLIFMTTSTDMSAKGPESISDNIFSVNDIMAFLDLPIGIAVYVKNAISKIFDLIWNCGIQIILFISGLQSIPNTLYEACKVEGATKWEQFWFITFPMLGRIIMLVVIFTMVELFTDTRNTLMNSISTLMQTGTYDKSSAMLWFYFMIVGAIIGVVLLLFDRFFLKKLE